MPNTQVMKVGLHYFFNDASHQMDAIVRHKCEGEFIKIIGAMSNILDLPIYPQTEAYIEGGLNEIWSFAKNNQYILGVITGVLIQVLSTQINIDRELVGLQKESIRLEIQEKKLNIQKLKKEIESGNNKVIENVSENLIFLMNTEYRAIRARSDLYKNLLGYQKITKISGQQLDSDTKPISDPKVVDRDQFKDFILSTDELPKEIDEAATIEVISPVLKQGKFKWRGIYEDLSIDFYMKDKVFKDSIYHKQVSFTNGVLLKCILEISKKMNEVGDIYVYNYSVLTVILYHLGENTFETKQGKNYFVKKAKKDKQMGLFDK